MSESINIRTTLGIDVSRNVIRINRTTLRSIGNPAYVQLLVNPGSRAIAVRAVDRAEYDDQTFRIPRKIRDSDLPATITSQAFMNLLTATFPELSPEHSYQLSGIIVPTERITLFSMDTMTAVPHG